MAQVLGHLVVLRPKVSVVSNETAPKAVRWSGHGKAWLVFWITLVAATVILVIFFPEWLVFEGRGGRGRRLPTLRELPALALLGGWLVGAICWVIWFRNNRRSAALVPAAQELNLELVPAPPDETWADLGHFAFCRIGFEQSGRNWMTGAFGDYEIAVLDYHFRRSALPKDVEVQMSSRKYHQTVAAFWSVSEALPNFQLVSREGWWRRPGKNRSPKGCITDLNVGKGINDDFYRHYMVGGPDEAALRAFFTPPLMEHFCAHKGWDIESADGHLLIYQERKLQPPVMMAVFLCRHAARPGRRVTPVVYSVALEHRAKLTGRSIEVMPTRDCRTAHE